MIRLKEKKQWSHRNSKHLGMFIALLLGSFVLLLAYLDEGVEFVYFFAIVIVLGMIALIALGGFIGWHIHGPDDDHRTKQR